MENVELILSLCYTIYQRVENIKSNKERCQRVAQRVQDLEALVLTIKQRGPGQISAPVHQALKDLIVTLNSAKEIMMTFSQTTGFKSFLKSSNHEEKFCRMNDRLNDNFQVLFGALQVEQGNILQKVYECVARPEEERPLTSPIAPMPPPTPTAPMYPPTPTAPLPLTMPMSNPMPPMRHPTPVYRPAAPTPVQYMVPPPRPVFVRAAAMPVRSIMSPVQMYNPVTMTRAVTQLPLSTAVVSQHVATTMYSVPTSPTTVPMQLITPVRPVTVSQQNASVGFINSFLR
ncbi:programmed cell death 6-interacting protein-like [Seriola lalandi dorsalis]|uniref:programmed cell death 6-interacting protein-like n=1 Tax=Seriola lalandi dorsalis TaxID=1841481 RepID=UPI000C6FB31A|nr:programmed cell death 6-interacting protein-like [Seriola lalandi dorsalis]XP_023276150.1 programmed cell death 6-interacting protein-like [Seriola lalandi dorsalis]